MISRYGKSDHKISDHDLVILGSIKISNLNSIIIIPVKL